MLIIGDVHGWDHENLLKYKKITDSCDSSVQIGDFGYQKAHDWHINNINRKKHKILFGNHDHYPYLMKRYSLRNFHFNDNVIYVRGAKSRISDRRKRPGKNWHENEEMDENLWYQCLTIYKYEQPEIIISHEAPDIVRYKILKHNGTTITSKNLQKMFEINRPRLWIFGHHHKSINVTLYGTKFVCLDTLETFNLEGCEL